MANNVVIETVKGGLAAVTLKASGAEDAVVNAAGTVVNSAPVKGFINSGPVKTVTGGLTIAYHKSIDWITKKAIPWITKTAIPKIGEVFQESMKALGPYGIAAVAAVAAIGAFAWWRSSGSSEPQAPAVDARQRAQELALARQQAINDAGVTNNVSTGHSAALEQQRAMQQQATGAQV